ncbi:MAG: hypothetical protein Ct9H300mP1_29880 [Planctomycetaceae bacterium]|nr:MAG: hypothetical protein Ct9H300mP1_29880 [Planctomycetaceae bacterium]
MSPRCDPRVSRSCWSGPRGTQWRLPAVRSRWLPLHRHRDSSGIADLYLTGQDLTNLSGAILRIDVDHPGEKLPYTVPRDNPFLQTKGARPEIWAYGLRQPGR